MRAGCSVGLVGIAGLVGGVIAALASPARAGTVAGRLELPPAPERGAVAAKGFLDRTENPLAEIKKPSLAPYYVVALEGDARPGGAPPEITWDLVGESFARPVIAVPVGAEVVIRNQSKVPRTLVAAEDKKLIVGPLNPKGTKSFRATEPAIYTIGDGDAPYLRGKLVVVATPHVAALDDAGRFELPNVPDGSYQLRVFYFDAAEARGGASGWVFATDVTVATRGKATRVEVNGKLPPIARTAAAAKPERK